MSAPYAFAVIRGLGKSSFIAGLLVSAGALQAAPPTPPNLGNGLDKLVQAKVPAYFLSDDARDQGNAVEVNAIKDDQGRVLVRINPTGDSVQGKPKVTVNALRNSLSSMVPSLLVTAVDTSYRGVGVMDAFVDLADVPALAAAPGVRSVILEWKPRHAPLVLEDADSAAKMAASPSAASGEVLTKLGTTFDQGVTQHGVDQINQFYNPNAPVDFEGQGMSIGFLSNSYAANTSHPASVDVANFDLPGAANNPVNTQPVVVLQDDTGDATSDDEGRGMIQIGYKMAPKARLAFASADFGEVGFANNIRALAGIATYTYPGQNFAADTICDDVGYFDEPYFQDGIIGSGVNDAAAAGVAYFSSAANDIGTNGYDSEIRLVPNDPTGSNALTFAGGNQALINTNINLANVPPNLYAGGFHNFNPNPGQQDIAQLVNVAANNTNTTTLEWNDPYDQNGGVSLTGQIYTNTGTYSTTDVTFDQTSTPPLPTFTAGQAYQVTETHTSGDYDAKVSIVKPDGTFLINAQDTGVDETVTFTAPTTGQYKIIFGHYQATTGNFEFAVNTANITQLVMSDWNLLAFNTTTGAYVPASSLTTDNIATNEPVELGYVNRTSATVKSIQYVFARANTPPPGARVANRIRYLIPANGAGGYGPAEYFTYNGVTTAGHAMANGSNGMAAFSVFRPSLPEAFTSPGPVRIYFDASGNALQLPEIRRQPRLAAADGANVSANLSAVFANDTGADLDTDGNFFGTSAAGPHAAAVAALVLQAHGGHGSITPTQMTSLLEHTTFAHDLDPSYSSGSAHTSDGGLVRFALTSDASNNAGTGANDTNAFAISYSGSGSLTSIVFNPQGTAQTAGNVSGGNNGYQDGNPGTVTYFENSYPGMVFLANTTFTVGSNSTVASASVTPAYSNLAPAPSNPGASNQYWTMTLNFDNTFTSGKVLNYTIGRGVQHSSSTSGGLTNTGGATSASYLGDLLGGGVSIPSGLVSLDGMTFSGTTSTGGTFNGVIRNRVGAGYSPVDGYGFINAATAVGATVQ